jgi:hypothetical protein
MKKKKRNEGNEMRKGKKNSPVAQETPTSLVPFLFHLIVIPFLVAILTAIAAGVVVVVLVPRVPVPLSGVRRRGGGYRSSGGGC